MKRTAPLVLLMLLGCHGRAAPAPQPTSASASASVASATSVAELALASDITAEGLQVRTGTWRGWGVSDVEPDPKRTALHIAKSPSPHGSPLAKLVLPGWLALINGGYFEADYRPSTWVFDGAELAPKSDTSKGGVLALGPDQLFIGAFPALRFEPTLAVQSFPLVVEAGGRVGIHKDDGRRAARTIACLVDQRLHFIVIAAPRGDGPTLLETAALLRAVRPAGFGCDVALNLDGGPSSGVEFATSVPAKSRSPLAPVGYALVVQAAARN